MLSRTVGDTATPTSALIPWNSCGAYMAATLGVATWSYAPYAVFSFVSPLLTIALAYAGIPHAAPAAGGTGQPAAGDRPALGDCAAGHRCIIGIAAKGAVQCH